MKREIIWSVFITVTLIIITAGFLSWLNTSGSQKRAGLLNLGKVKDFQFTNQHGKPFGSKDLNGKIWIANFFFTRCQNPCPQLMGNLAKLEKIINTDIRFVSFTVDPKHDTAQALNSYADRYNTNQIRWTYITGTKNELYDFILNALKVPVEETNVAAQPFIHDSRFVLFDRDGTIRSYYQGLNSESIAKLKSDAEKLNNAFSIYSLPAVNAGLNTACFLLLVTGLIFIKRKNITAHKMCMLAALVTSILFLTCYLTYHYHAGSVKFKGEGGIRIVYFSILISHTVLAAAVVPLAGVTIFRAMKEDFERHKKIAKLTMPVWLYVSITGVIIYFMLYHIYK